MHGRQRIAEACLPLPASHSGGPGRTTFDKSCDMPTCGGESKLHATSPCRHRFQKHARSDRRRPSAGGAKVGAHPRSSSWLASRLGATFKSRRPPARRSRDGVPRERPPSPHARSSRAGVPRTEGCESRNDGPSGLLHPLHTRVESLGRLGDFLQVPRRLHPLDPAATFHSS